jgi:hypothetical protein
MILNMYKSRRIVEVDEFCTRYDNNSHGFGTVYAITRNGEAIALTSEVPQSNVVSYGYMQNLQGPNASPDEENMSNKDIWGKIKKAIMSNKPVSLPL